MALFRLVGQTRALLGGPANLPTRRRFAGVGEGAWEPLSSLLADCRRACAQRRFIGSKHHRFLRARMPETAGHGKLTEAATAKADKADREVVLQSASTRLRFPAERWPVACAIVGMGVAAQQIDGRFVPRLDLAFALLAHCGETRRCAPPDSLNRSRPHSPALVRFHLGCLLLPGSKATSSQEARGVSHSSDRLTHTELRHDRTGDLRRANCKMKTEG